VCPLLRSAAEKTIKTTIPSFLPDTYVDPAVGSGGQESDHMRSAFSFFSLTSGVQTDRHAMRSRALLCFSPSLLLGRCRYKGEDDGDDKTLSS